MEEEDEEGSPGGSNVVLGQHSTAGRYQHYINTEQDLKEKEEEYICNPELLAVGVVCKRTLNLYQQQRLHMSWRVSFTASLLCLVYMHRE